ncbi:hypothetical protein OG582_00090 [Streptomyces anulatus]|uniref:hypothetical protein n=1 Tax=Streptomyces anulatus TaxID=1892 RepID=UPI002F91A018|nr:hypothetical protein OH737_40090 [Streptomyces anulatus]
MEGGRGAPFLLTLLPPSAPYTSPCPRAVNPATAHRATAAPDAAVSIRADRRLTADEVTAAILANPAIAEAAAAALERRID